MPLAKCGRCGKMFNKWESPVCKRCQEDEDADMETIRGALVDDPGMNAEQVAEVTGVDMACVLRIVDRGLVSVTDVLDKEQTKCEQCGKPAISAAKRLCESCLEKLNQEVGQTRAKMHLGGKKGGGQADKGSGFHTKRR